jgi:hypothetical protein
LSKIIACAIKDEGTTKMEESSVKESAAMRLLILAQLHKFGWRNLRSWIQNDPCNDYWRNEALADLFHGSRKGFYWDELQNVMAYLQDRMEIIPKTVTRQFKDRLEIVQEAPGAREAQMMEIKKIQDEQIEELKKVPVETKKIPKALIKEVITIPEEVKKTPKVEEIPEAIKSNNIDEISKKETSDKLIKVPEEMRLNPIVMEMNSIEIENKYITNLKQNITNEHKHEPPDDLSNSGYDKKVEWMDESKEIDYKIKKKKLEEDRAIPIIATKMAHNCHKCEMCKLCNKKLKNRANLKKHINGEHDVSLTNEISEPEAIVYDCHECGRLSSIQQRENKNTLKKHIKREPPDDLPSLEYDEQIKLIKDSKMTYKEGKCESCGLCNNKEFKNKANLKKHIKHEQDISFTNEISDCMISNCQECGKISSIQQHENTLKTHIKQEPPDDLTSLEYDEQIKLIKDSKMTYKEEKCESCC